MNGEEVNTDKYFNKGYGKNVSYAIGESMAIIFSYYLQKKLLCIFAL